MKKRELKKDYNLWLEELRTGKRFKFWAREICNNKKALLLSVVFIIIAVVLNVISGKYVTEVGVGVPTDIILNNVGPYNLQIFFGWGYLFFMVLLFLFPLFFRIKSLHRVIGHWSLLVMMRSFFISLTHLKTPLTAIPAKFPQIFQPFVFENDLFFSGHTATTFLGFLLFKDSKIKWVFLAGSIFMGSVTLLMHRHYSIDVFAAYFITYGTYTFGNWFFKKIKH